MAMMEYLMSPRGIIKLIQMLLMTVVLGLWFGVIGSSWDYFCTGTVFLAFFTSIFIFGQNMLLGPSRVLEILTSALCGLFLFVMAVLVLVKVPGSNVSVKGNVADACGAFALFALVAYAADVFFAFKIETTEG